MDYADFEAGLAQLHFVPDDRRKTFRARLRTLRDAGVPRVQKSGKGSRVTFSLENLWESHFGLRLVDFGLPPARVAKVLEICRHEKWFEKATKYSVESDLWLRLELGGSDQKITGIPENEWGEIGSLQYHFERLAPYGASDMSGMMNLSQVTRNCEMVLLPRPSYL